MRFVLKTAIVLVSFLHENGPKDDPPIQNFPQQSVCSD